MREVGQAAAARGLAVLDCPVSGSPAEARVGRLILIVGGDRSDVERAEPLMKLLGTDWKHTGGVGTAKVVKIVNNMMSMGNVLVAAEAFALGVAAGVEPDKLYEVLSVSGGRSHHFTKRFPNALKGDFAPGFKMESARRIWRSVSSWAAACACRRPPPPRCGSSMPWPWPKASAVKDIVALLAMYRGWAKAAGGSQDGEGAGTARAEP